MLILLAYDVKHGLEMGTVQLLQLSSPMVIMSFTIYVQQVRRAVGQHFFTRRVFLVGLTGLRACISHSSTLLVQQKH